MVTLLAKIFIQEKNDQAKIREEYGVLCGVVGILFNVLLFAGKFLAGTISHSIAITADAVNNLSDAGSSIVTLAGFKLAGTKPDPEHPFGHGRIEYISGLVVAAAILLMAYELIRDSVGKIVHPEETEFSGLIVVILVLSILVKLYMFLYNRRLGKKLASPAMEATAMDSLSDSVATAAVLIATLVGRFTGLEIDGWCGVLVAAFILWSGINAVRDTLDPLLGRAMDPELAADIDKLVLSHPNILGIHDLVYHDYGPGRAMMSFHAEVPADTDLLEMHDIIDHIERELKAKHHIETVIHTDPVVNDERTNALREQVEAAAKALDPALSIHDLRITAGPYHTNVLFDVMVPYGFRLTDAQVPRELRQAVEALSEKYSAVIQVDHSYVERREDV